MNDARHDAQNGDFEGLEAPDPYAAMKGTADAEAMIERARDLGLDRPAGDFYVEDLQTVEPELLEPADGIVLDISLRLDAMGYSRATVYGPTREAVIEYVRSQWGDEDPQWFQEYVVDRVRSTERLAMTTPAPEVPCLVVRVDGENHAVVPLRDGDDVFNAAAERGALDRAYEAKESNPRCAVEIVVLTVDPEQEELDRQHALDILETDRQRQDREDYLNVREANRLARRDDRR